MAGRPRSRARREATRTEPSKAEPNTSSSSTTGDLSVTPPANPPLEADTGAAGEDRPTMPISEATQNPAQQTVNPPVPQPGAAAQRQAEAFRTAPGHPGQHSHRFQISTTCKACGRVVSDSYPARSDAPGACVYCGGPTVVTKDVDTHA